MEYRIDSKSRRPSGSKYITGTAGSSQQSCQEATISRKSLARTRRSTTRLGKRADGKNAEGRCSDHATRSHPSQHRREADSYVKNAKAISRQEPQGKRTDAFPPRDRTAPKREPGSERRHIKTAEGTHTREATRRQLCWDCSTAKQAWRR